jgi:hypothetical protein
MESASVTFPVGSAAISAHQVASLNVILIWYWELEFDVKFLYQYDLERMFREWKETCFEGMNSGIYSQSEERNDFGVILSRGLNQVLQMM